MNTHILTPVLIAFLLSSVSAAATEGMVTISSPQNESIIYQNDKIIVSYKATLGPEGDHLHLNIDGKRMDVIHQLEGNIDIGKLPVGKHHICLAINTKSHVPTGNEGCVDITSK
jgi:hypothetical protein